MHLFYDFFVNKSQSPATNECSTEMKWIDEARASARLVLFYYYFKRFCASQHQMMFVLSVKFFKHKPGSKNWWKISKKKIFQMRCKTISNINCDRSRTIVDFVEEKGPPVRITVCDFFRNLWINKQKVREKFGCEKRRKEEIVRNEIKIGFFTMGYYILVEKDSKVMKKCWKCKCPKCANCLRYSNSWFVVQ